MAQLVHGGDGGGHRVALGASYGQSIELAGGHEALRDVHRQEAHIDLAREQVLRVASRAPVGHMQHEELGLAFKEFHGHVVRGADAGGAVIDAARFGAGLGQQVGQGFDIRFGVGDQHERAVGGHAHGGEVFHRVKGHGFVKLRGHEHGVGPHEQGVAVGVGLGHSIRADVAAGPGHIAHHHRLAQALGQLGTNRAGNGVHAGACGEGHDELDGLLGPCWRRRRGLRKGLDAKKQGK